MKLEKLVTKADAQADAGVRDKFQGSPLLLPLEMIKYMGRYAGREGFV
jgi:hypothetical protein